MPLSQQHKDDLAAFETATKDYNQFLEAHKDDIGTPKVYAQACTIRENVKSLHARVETHVKAEDLRRDANQFTDYLTGAERKDLGQYPGKRPWESLGTTTAGHVTIDAATKQFMEDVGPGTFGEKAWDGIQDPGYAKAYREYIKHGERMPNWAYKNLEVGLDPAAGYLAPIDVQMRLVERQATPTRVAGMVTNLNTGRDAVVLPKVNYSTATDDSTGNLYSTPFRVTWTGENPAVSSGNLNPANVSDSSLVGQIRIDVFTAMIEGILTNNMVEDSAFNLQGWYEGKFNETAELLYDNMILNGTGQQQPWGINNQIGTVDGTVGFVTSGSSGVIGGDDLIDTAYSVPEQYEDNLQWVFNKTNTMKALRTLKDSQNRYLFGQGYNDSGLVVGKPSDLVGYKFNYSGFAQNIASGNTPVLFGDLRGYYKVNRLGFYVQVLREVEARRNQIILLGRLRFGGKVAEPWRMKALKVA